MVCLWIWTVSYTHLDVYKRQQISYIGYLPQVVKVQSGVTSYNVTLKEDTKTLDEVVVIGDGTQKKVNSVSYTHLLALALFAVALVSCRQTMQTDGFKLSGHLEAVSYTHLRKVYCFFEISLGDSCIRS